MTFEEVWDSVSLFAEAAMIPVLTDADLETLVNQARRADTAGRAPSDAAWEPTWNVGFAVALGWRLKLGRLVSSYDFKSSDQAWERSQIFNHCKDMLKFWEGQSGLLGGGSVSGVGTIQLRGLPTRPRGSADIGDATGDGSEVLRWEQIANWREMDY